MECNRDEAIRAKEIAEMKFTAKDIVGAKKFAAKAQSLYPSLEGIQQMLDTLDIYLSAENRINGEADWYGILGVNPLADEEIVRKQYRKLALMLHPDKNKSVGAEGAFKLISEAWSLLSDKSKRSAYDQKRNVKVFQQKAPPTNGGPSAPSRSTGFPNVSKSATTHTKGVHKGNTNKSAASHGSASPHQRPHTFWTVCHRCKTQYEYLRTYLNHNLLCPNCHEPFFAVETAPPPSSCSRVPPQWKYSQQQQQQNSNHQEASVSTAGRNKSASVPDSSKGQWAPFSKTSNTSSVAQAATMVQQAYEKVKREREEAQAATKREEAVRKKTNASRRTSSVSSSNAVKRRRGTENLGAMKYGRANANPMGMGTGRAGTANLSGVKQGNSHPEASGHYKPRAAWDLSHLEIQGLLIEKARLEIDKKLNEWTSATASKGMEKVNEKGKEEVKEIDNGMVNGAKQDQHITGKPDDMKNENHEKELSAGRSSGNVNKVPLEPVSIDVIDPDFHDFDKDRNEQCFGENQVWAAYDDDDGMPRYYAMIHDVISRNPFKARISWLNSKTNNELGPLNWVGSGFSKTCGDFRVGKHEVNHSLNSFSHKIRWTKGAHGAVRIFPRKGDIWALYRNWSPEWNELTADEIIHKYDMVEVLEDYDEQLGVTVTPLVKVAGFKTVFHLHLDAREVKRIPREEMFRFSHQVPSYMLTGQEAPKALKGCWELDPAATPLELLHAVIDAKDEHVAGSEGTNSVGEAVDDSAKSNNKEVDESSAISSEK
ncbi:uncharacterized protein LOC127798181 [Diospyros lotus]|uniref:uncharacterized protein LOC127798181 n=1 Tax=Diospyros lotus TaxID=55363 RepID=UPI00225AD52E|nr:uncharacterized protein LOC127798181 [Diospyros lotus]XP_052187513.1 uncharacterized protein LOC127798181 [Diospyros lotus]